MTDTFARMRQLNGTTAEWSANDLVIGLGEFALEKIAGGAMRLKLGDGVAKFSQLPYFDPGVFSYVLKGGDTMSGPLVAPGVTINAGGLTVSAGNSVFTAPITLGLLATTAEPGATHNNDATIPTTHWVQTQVAGVITGLNYLGTWDAATNTPPLASGGLGVPTPARGDFYMVSVAGSTDLDGNTAWLPGDFVAFNGVAWQRIPQPLTYDQIVAGLGYVPASEAELDAVEAAAIPKAIVDAAGDLIVGTGADAVARLAKGAAGAVLKSTASGIVWDATTPAAFNVRATANDTINGPQNLNAFRPLVAPVEDYDPDSVWDNANGIFTAPSHGRYHFECFGYSTSNPAGQVMMAIQHQSNAGAAIRTYGSAHNNDPTAYGASQHCAVDLQMTAAERVMFFWATNSGVTVTAASGTIGGLAAQALVYAFGHRIGN